MKRILHQKVVASIVAATVVALVSAPRAVLAAGNGMPQFGSVDVQKVLANYNKKSALDAQVADMNQRLDAQFKIQVGSGMLNKLQQDQLGTLLNKVNKSDSDQAQITALEAESTKDSQELIGLQTKTDPSQADKDRLVALTKQQQDGQQILQDVATQYRAQVQAQNDKLSADLTDSVKVAIAAVAKQRGIDVVFDSQVAIYTSNDLTADVDAKLNK